MLDRFTSLKTVDFNASNVYALVLWVIKNANKYYKSQMVDFFKALSYKDNVRNYVSNKRVFEGDGWRYCRDFTHYTLDYRIICTKHALPGESDYVTSWEYSDNKYMKPLFARKIEDICTVANNLGFTPCDIELPELYGKKGFVYMNSGKAKPDVLFEFRCYANGNVHVKFNIEFIKALNVVVARELGWIHSREDIAREFTPEMARGAEKYFDKTIKIGLSSVPMLMNSAEAAGATPERAAEPQEVPGAKMMEARK
jgi:hypothetical protein